MTRACGWEGLGFRQFMDQAHGLDLLGFRGGMAKGVLRVAWLMCPPNVAIPRSPHFPRPPPGCRRMTLLLMALAGPWGGAGAALDDTWLRPSR